MIQKEDIKRVAEKIKMQLTDNEIDEVMNEYNQYGDSDEPWYILVEDIIYNIIQTKNHIQ